MEACHTVFAGSRLPRVEQFPILHHEGVGPLREWQSPTGSEPIYSEHSDRGAAVRTPAGRADGSAGTKDGIVNGESGFDDALDREPSLSTTEDGLRTLGFVGFQSVADLRQMAAGRFVNFRRIPTAHGVYAVVAPVGFTPRFLAKPLPALDASLYSADDLQSRGVDGVETLNFGKTDAEDGLQERVRRYVRFGLGKRTTHRGGRSIWQLERCEDLRMGYLETEGRQKSARDVELELKDAFRRATGKVPFAWLERRS